MTADPPRVFHLITRLVGGGAEDETILTLSKLDGYRCTLGHGASVDAAQREHVERAGIETRRVPLLRHYNPLTAPLAVASVARHLRRADYDLVHTHSTEAGIVGRAAAAIADVPVVVHTVHGVPFTADRSALLNRFVLACERAAAPLADRIVVNADAVASEYRSRGIGRPDQYVTVPSGIDLETYRDATPATDLPGERPRVVMVARLAEGKGFDVLLEAIERLETPPGSVCLVGDGPLADAIASRIDERDLGGTVHLLGYREDVPRVLAASDVLVLPSYREGTPRAVSEAMAAGLPVVATDVAGIPDQVLDGETGYLVPPGDAAAFADRLGALLENPELRAAMGRRGRERADRFGADAMVEAIQSLYATLLSDADGSGPPKG